jgi:prefoldin subunit 5
MQHSYYRSPFQLIDNIMQLPFGSDVYVISDSAYKKIRKKQAEDEIAVLQKRLEAYERSALSLQETIDELRSEHQIALTEASEE